MYCISAHAFVTFNKWYSTLCIDCLHVVSLGSRSNTKKAEVWAEKKIMKLVECGFSNYYWKTFKSWEWA